MNLKNTEFSDLEKSLLHHEKLISKLLSIRDKNNKHKKKCLLLRFFETAGGVAFITVLLTGIFGTILNSNIQKNIKEREYQHDVLKALNTTLFELEKSFFSEQINITKKTLQVIGEIIQSTEDIVIIKGPYFNRPFSQKSEEKIIVKKQIEKIRKDFNNAYRKWNRNRYTYGLLLSYYYYGNRKVKEAWKILIVSINNFIEWALQLDSSEFDENELKKRLKEIESLVINLCNKLRVSRLDGIQDWRKSIENLFIKTNKERLLSR